jgi:hypothetical protein
LGKEGKAGLEIQEVSEGVFHHAHAPVFEVSQFFDEVGGIETGQALDVHGGGFR